MPKPLVLMVGADKGGVGKTMVCRALVDCFTSRKQVTRVYDSESPAGDLKRFHPDARIIDLGNIKDQMAVFDALAADATTVVDIRAGVLTPTLKVLDKGGVLEDVRNGTVIMAVLHVLGPSISSLNEVGEAVRTIGGGTRHYIVKNHINDTDYDLANDPRFASVFSQLEPVTINVPKLNELAAERVQKAECSFMTFAGNASNSRMLRGHVASWLAEVWKEFDRVGINGLVAASAAP